MYGDGLIYKETVGKYTYWAVQYYLDGIKHKKRFPCTVDGKREARKFCSKARIIKKTTKAAPTSMPLGEWIVEYMSTYLKPKYRPQTYDRAKATAKKLAPIAGLAIDEITAEDIQKLYNSYSETLAPATIYKIHKLLAGAYKKAYLTGRITYNPMIAVEPPKVTQEEVAVFSFEELLRLFRVLRQPRWSRYCTFYYLLLTTGMRVGELLALRFEDVDFNGREIHVSRTKVGRSGNNFNSPKTRAGDRYIPIVYDKVAVRIKELRTSGNVTRMTGLLFQTRFGNAWNYNNVRRDWVKICAEAGIQLKHIHVFRHTFATYALAKGVPVLEVSRILGHSTATTTLTMYGHAMPGYNRRLIEKVKSKKETVKNKDRKIQN